MPKVYSQHNKNFLFSKRIVMYYSPIFSIFQIWIISVSGSIMFFISWLFTFRATIFTSWSSHLFYCTYKILHLSTISSHVFNSFTDFMENNKTVSLSIPKEVLNQIDTDRGDITRSKFILRLIESKNTLGKQQQIPEKLHKELLIS